MNWIEKFGFGKTTGIDFPGESPGFVLPLEKWYGSTIGNVPIGQGIAVTPIQMASAYAAIANGGVWVQPHLVERVGGQLLQRPQAPPRRLARDRRGAEEDADGRRRRARRDRQRGRDPRLHRRRQDRHGAGAGAARLHDGKYVASFVGMVPVKKPRLVVLVVVNEPTRGIFGGTVAAPAFAEIAKFDLQYLGVAPDHRVAPDAVNACAPDDPPHERHPRPAGADRADRDDRRAREGALRPHRALPRRGRRRGDDEPALEPDEGHGDAPAALGRGLRRRDGRQRLLAALRPGDPRPSTRAPRPIRSCSRTSPASTARCRRCSSARSGSSASPSRSTGSATLDWGFGRLDDAREPRKAAARELRAEARSSSSCSRTSATSTSIRPGTTGGSRRSSRTTST